MANIESLSLINLVDNETDTKNKERKDENIPFDFVSSVTMFFCIED